VKLISRSLSLSIDEIVGDIELENEIINILLECQNKFQKYFKVFLFHRDLKQADVKGFLSRHSKNLTKIDNKITKRKIQYSWFIINLDESQVSRWRYMYSGGDIKEGLQQYVYFSNHIQRRDR